MGLAYLPDGRRMDYEEYLRSREWRTKKANRLAFDNWQCGICHAEITDHYETHHLNYSKLGNEDIEKDLISLCSDCHKLFHELWNKSDAWVTSPITHWKDYDLKHTAAFCMENLENDYFFGGKFNLCNIDSICQLIDAYFSQHDIKENIRIDPQDVRLYFRNKRYDILLNADSNNEPLEDMLDRLFGPKGIKGGNPNRAAARSFCTKHKIPAIKRFYKENQNVMILMDTVKNINSKENK